MGAEPSIPRVLIADDDDDVRAVLATQLGGEFEVVANARDADEAIALAAEHQPDIAIVDVQMPGGGGPSATRGIRGAAAGTAIVALSCVESERIVLVLVTACCARRCAPASASTAPAPELARLQRVHADGDRDDQPAVDGPLRVR